MRRLLAAVTLVLAIFVAGAGPAQAHYGSTSWDCMAHYESTHRWAYNGSSGYDGGLQFSPRTWRQYTGSSAPNYAWQASRKFQIKVAKRVAYYGFYRHEPQGWTAWRNTWWKCH